MLALSMANRHESNRKPKHKLRSVLLLLLFLSESLKK